MKNSSLALTALSVAALFVCLGCEKKEKFEVAQDSVSPGSTIGWVGQKANLSAPSVALAVGKVFPEVTVINSTMKEELLRFGDGKVRIISVIPSIDTPVCEEQSHILGESKGLDPAVEKLSVSMDLPYAQRRFVEEAKLKGVTFFSDYRSQDFGKKLGLLVDRNGLLARAVLVIDADGVVRHFQITPEVAKLPDLEKAFQVANQLAAAGK